MRTDEKMERLLDMTEHPERYTVDELTDMLDDPQAQEWTNLMVEMKQTLSPSLPHNGEGDHAARRFALAWWKMAAAIAALFVLSGIAYAAWHYSHNSQSSHPSQLSRSSEIPSASTHPDSLGTAILFDKVPLDSILTEVSAHYQKSVAFRSDALRALRFHVEWDRADSLRAFTDLLNEFDGIHLTVENDTIFVEQE